MRVLIAEDEQALAQVLKKGLEEQGFTVELSASGEDVLFLAQTYDFDCILLDIMLPEVDGLTILKKLRRQGNETPILMLTARREMQDKVDGLESGADDYIAKPFDFPELVARIRSAIRRNKGKPAPEIRIGDLCIDTNTRAVEHGGQALKLSSKEYEYLEYLALNQQRIVSRNELLEHLYSAYYEYDSNIVDVYISNLRRKVDRDFELKLIHTVRGAGYRLSADFCEEN
jgi:DNA-binding response OmpR family regulator